MAVKPAHLEVTRDAPQPATGVAGGVMSDPEHQEARRPVHPDRPGDCVSHVAGLRIAPTALTHGSRGPTEHGGLAPASATLPWGGGGASLHGYRPPRCPTALVGAWFGLIELQLIQHRLQVVIDGRNGRRRRGRKGSLGDLCSGAVHAPWRKVPGVRPLGLVPQPQEERGGHKGTKKCGRGKFWECLASGPRTGHPRPRMPCHAGSQRRCTRHTVFRGGPRAQSQSHSLHHASHVVCWRQQCVAMPGI